MEPRAGRAPWLQDLPRAAPLPPPALVRMALAEMSIIGSTCFPLDGIVLFSILPFNSEREAGGGRRGSPPSADTCYPPS